MKYKWRNLPITKTKNEKGGSWCVTGEIKDKSSAGVLEWCYSEDDAEMVKGVMEESGEFNHLQVELW
jgi:hypothetical protein